MPMPGDVDVVLASELMEAARAVERGFVTPDRTLLIASTHRVFAMTEKIALADGRADAAALLRGLPRRRARQLVAFDMAALADATGSVLSAVLFGALAGSGALPFPRPAFEAAIRRGEVGVNTSLAAFGAGFEAARAGEAALPRAGTVITRRIVQLPRFARIAARRRAGFFRRSMADRRRRRRTADRLPGRRLRRRLPRAARSACATSSSDTATAPAGCLPKPRASSRSAWPTRTPSAWPTSRSARAASRACARKRRSRTGRFSRSPNSFIRARRRSPTRCRRRSGRWLMRTALGARLVDRLTRKGRVVKTTSISGFSLLYLLSKLKPLRRRSLRFARRAGRARGVARPGGGDRADRLCAGRARWRACAAW